MEENKVEKSKVEKKRSAKELLDDQKDAFDNSIGKNTQEWAEFEDNRSKINAKNVKIQCQTKIS